jgi:SAM-dependent methyltransferase
MLKLLRSVLAVPQAYQLWWTAVGGPALTKVLVTEYIRPAAGDRVLEIGCGPGSIVRYLPEVEYSGFDLSSRYIELARKRYPRARFTCERVSRFSATEMGAFDLVLALGIVHHLDDIEARRLFQIAYDALHPAAKLITIDGVWTNDQPTTTKWLLGRDRGEHVRSQQEYMAIASRVFKNIRPNVRHDLLRIPYSHLILECTR